MELTEIRVGCPVLQYVSSVTHSTPWKPTAVERMLLDMHDRLASHEDYAAIGLDRLFTDLLGVPEAMVLAALDRLIVLQAMRTQANTQSLAQVSLQHLERTPLGGQLLTDGQLPGAAREDAATHTYDPVRGTLKKDMGSGRVVPERPRSAVPAQAFQGVFPGELIQRAIPGENRGWWRLDTQVEGIRCKSTQVLWRVERGRVQVSERGDVTIQFEDAKLTDYVRKLDSATVWDQILRPGLSATNGLQNELPPRDFATLSDTLADLFSIRDLPARLRLDEGVHLVELLPRADAVPVEAPARSAVLVFSDAEALSSAAVFWNEDGSGAAVHLPEPFPVPEALYAGLQGSCLGAGTFELRLGGDPISVPMGYALKPDHGGPPVQRALAQVQRLLMESDSEDDWTLPSVWLDPSEFWPALCRHIGQTAESVETALVSLGRARDRVRALTGKRRVPDWPDRVCDLVRAHLDVFRGSLTADAVEAVLSALDQWEWADGQVIAAVRERLDSGTQTPEQTGKSQAGEESTPETYVLDPQGVIAHPHVLIHSLAARDVIAVVPGRIWEELALARADPDRARNAAHVHRVLSARTDRGLVRAELKDDPTAARDSELHPVLAAARQCRMDGPPAVIVTDNQAVEAEARTLRFRTMTFSGLANRLAPARRPRASPDRKAPPPQEDIQHHRDPGSTGARAPAP